MTPTLTCERCKQPIRLKVDRWARRRIPEQGGRFGIVCAACVQQIDAQTTLEATRDARTTRAVDTAVASRLRALARIESPFVAPRRAAA